MIFALNTQDITHSMPLFKDYYTVFNEMTKGKQCPMRARATNARYM